jgi:hypothetical protein
VTGAAFAVEAADRTAPDARRSAYVKLLGDELTVAEVLPASIQDPMLLEAWIRLDNRQDPIALWDGRTTTGHDLAQFLLAQAIPVVWDTDGVCGSGSCSVYNCRGDVCSYDDGQPGVDPIFILPVAQPFGHGMDGLVSTLAHEIFHRTQPFGPVFDTRFEEYWAFFVGTQISPSVGLSFGTYDPLDPDHLNLWIKDNRVDAYFQLPAYPTSVEPTVSASTSSNNFNGLPSGAIQPSGN